jgi:hypothetical protein
MGLQQGAGLRWVDEGDAALPELIEARPARGVGCAKPRGMIRLRVGFALFLRCVLSAALRNAGGPEPREPDHHELGHQRL